MPNQTMVYSCSAPEQEYTMVWFGNESFTEDEHSIPKELTFASATCGASPK